MVFTKEVLDHLYYNRFEYCGRVSILNARSASYCASLLDYKLRISTSDNNYWFSYAMNRGKVVNSSNIIDYRLSNLPQVEQFIGWHCHVKRLKESGIDCVIRIQNNSVSLFSNDLSVIKTMSMLEDSDTIVCYAQCEQPESQSSGAMDLTYPVHVMKNPQHRYRVYLRSQSITHEERKEFVKFIENIPNGMYPSRGLRDWAKPHVGVNGGYWNWRQHTIPKAFIDYDVDHVLVHLQLMWSRYLGESFLLEKESHRGVKLINEA